MSQALVLFDVDGTLLVTGGAGMRTMARVGAELFGEAFSLARVQAAGHLDPLIFAEAVAGGPLAGEASHHDRFRRRYLAELGPELRRSAGQVRALPGVHSTLAELRRRDGLLTLGLLTGNYAAAVPIKLSAAGIDPAWFVLGAYGDEGGTRPALLALGLERYRRLVGRPADPARVVVVGDTPRDVQCARAHGCRALAVATGPFGVAALREAGADVVVENLEDPTPLLMLAGVG